MTTIFGDAKKGLLVCDSQVTFGDQWIEDHHKVVRVGEELIGMAGAAVEGDRWLQWYKTGQNGPAPKTPNASALILGKEGLRVLEAGGGMWTVPGQAFGIGSGGAFARAAFMAGADAKKAVEIACLIDTNSGGTVHVHKLHGR